MQAHVTGASRLRPRSPHLKPRHVVCAVGFLPKRTPERAHGIKNMPWLPLCPPNFCSAATRLNRLGGRGGYATALPPCGIAALITGPSTIAVPIITPLDARRGAKRTSIRQGTVLTVPENGNGMICTALPQAGAERHAQRQESNSGLASLP